MTSSAGSQPPDFNAFAALFANYPASVEGKWYFGKRLGLDGYRFVRCRFDNCELTIAKGTFTLDHCVFSGCSLSFSGEVLKVSKLATIVYRDLEKLWPNLKPTVNEDGTISIN